jgi:hypothetical protein
MKQLITFLISITVGQFFINDQTTPDKNFNLINDFQHHKSIFRTDKFDLAGQSTEGGELVVFHHKDKVYVVVDIWIFGEMGKINATYWMDKSLNFLIVKRIDFTYDKPFYEKDFKVKEMTTFLSFNSDKVKGYDNVRKELDDSQTTKMKKEYEEFFTEVTKGLKIVK